MRWVNIAESFFRIDPKLLSLPRSHLLALSDIARSYKATGAWVRIHATCNGRVYGEIARVQKLGM